MSRNTPKTNAGLLSTLEHFAPSKSDLRRVKILEAAIDCIAGGGMEDFSYSEIGKRSKMRRSHLIYYFPKLDSILEATIQYVVAIGQQITVAKLSNCRTRNEAINAFFDANVEWFLTYPKHASVFVLLYFLAGTRSEYRALHQKIQQSGEDRLEIILGMEPKTKLAKGINAKTLRAFIVGSFVSMSASNDPKEYPEGFARIKKTFLAMAGA